MVGKFKDETDSKKITDIVGLRRKMYRYTVDGDPNPDAHHRAKGIASATYKKLHHQYYLDQLHLSAEHYLPNRRIAHKLHQLYALEVQKGALCAVDDKRFLLDDGAYLIFFN